MKKVVFSLLFFSILILTIDQVGAQVSVTLSLDRSEATLADSIRLEVLVSGTRRSDAPPVIEGLETFHVTGGGSASRVEIINGRYSSSVAYTYYLQPVKKGVFPVGPAKVKVDGKPAKSNTVTLKVVDADNVTGGDRNPVFLKASLSKEKAYVEEQVPYTLKLYLRADVSDISLDLPEADEFTFRQLEKPKESQTVHQGVTYRILEVSYAVAPLKAGALHIPPARMKLTVYGPQKRTRRGLFEDPFFGGALRTGRPLTLVSESLALKVLPFPEKDKPNNFSGLVGSFTIGANLSTFETRVGESATLTVHLSGKGNVNRLPDLKMPEMEHLKIYADEPVFESKAGADGLSGSKTMKWALVPGKEGLYKIPAFSVGYFDPEAHTYRTAKTNPLALKVLPGNEETNPTIPPSVKQEEASQPAKQAVKEIGRDILPIHTAASGLDGNVWLTSNTIGPGNLFCWVVLLAPFWVYLAIFLGLRLQKKSHRTFYAQRARKAAHIFMKECRREEKDANGMMTAVRDYINDRFQLSRGTMTPADMADLLKAEGVRQETAGELQKVLERLEGRIYTGRETACGSARQEIFNIIKQIEKEI